MKLLHYTASEKHLRWLELGLIVATSSLPLLFSFPYRINLFLAWEGAFRMANGEIPYRDFGTPVGYGFWILPALFFKLFGPHVYTLIVVQVFINIISGVTFRAILKLFSVTAPVRLLALLVFSLSYTMFNFWPWYNHFVFVVEMIGFYFLCGQLLKAPAVRRVWPLLAGAFFVALAFLTKQDTGGLALMIAVALLLFDGILEKKLKTAMIFLGAYAASLALLIVPFLPYEFSYWFNMGQFPHNARVDKFDIVSEFLGATVFIKFYLIFIAMMVLYKIRTVASIAAEKPFFLFALLVLTILAQASIIQVTSYTPLDGNIYYHSFAFAFLLFFFASTFDYANVVNLSLVAVLVCLWWSGVFWTRFLREKVQKLLVKEGSNEHVISKRTYLLSSDTLSHSRSRWVVPGISSFKRVKVPQGTADGIEQLLAMPEAKKENLKMLNMSELTPLAFDMGYALERGASYPLWFHKGVSFFDREVKTFCDKVSKKEYDIILFEDIPNVNQFYPYEVRDCIREQYTFKFKFLAPRVPEISYIEVYTKE